MNYRRQEMKTFTATLSNGKSVTITAPSVQRARLRLEREIAKRGSKVQIISVV